MADPIVPSGGREKTRCLALEEDDVLKPRKQGAGDQDLHDLIDCKNRETFDLHGSYDYASEVFSGGFSHGNTLKGMNYGLDGAFKIEGPAGGVRTYIGVTAPLSDKWSFTFNGGLGIGAAKAGDTVRLTLDANADANLRYFPDLHNTFFLNAGVQGRVSFYVDVAQAQRTAAEADPRFAQLKAEVDRAVAKFKTDVRAAFAGMDGVIDQIMAQVDNQMGPVATALPGALLNAILSGGDTSGILALIQGATNAIAQNVDGIAQGAGTQAMQKLNQAIDRLKKSVLASLSSAGKDMQSSIEKIGSVGGGGGWSAELGWKGRYAVRGTEPELGNMGGGIFVEPSLSLFAEGPFGHFGLDSAALPNDADPYKLQVGLSAGFRVSFEIPKTTIGLYLDQSFKAPVEIVETKVGGHTEVDAKLGLPSAVATGGAALRF